MCLCEIHSLFLLLLSYCNITEDLYITLAVNRNGSQKVMMYFLGAGMWGFHTVCLQGF